VSTCRTAKTKIWYFLFHFSTDTRNIFIQGVSEIRQLILTSERTRQFIKLFSITFWKIRKLFQDFLPPNFYQTSRFVATLYIFVTMRILIFHTPCITYYY
jgi:hypothetical protein